MRGLGYTLPMNEFNPYHPLSPPDDPTLFFGRQEAIAFLRRWLVGGHNHEAIVLLGRIGMGKTALLHQVAYIVDERYIPVYIPLTELHPIDELALIRQTASLILSRLEAINVDTYRIPAFPTEEATLAHWQHWFAEEFLAVATTAIRRDRFLLLLFDDWHLIYEAIDGGVASDNAMGYWGSLLAQYDRLDMILAVDIADEQRALADSFSANIQQHFRLVALDVPTTLQLMIEPLQGAFEYTPQALARLHGLCGGYPFLIHSLCRLIYRHHQQNAYVTHIAPEFIEVLYPAALQETNQVMDSFWENSTPNMQAVMRVLLASPHRQLTLEELQTHLVSLNPTQIVATLRRLDYWGVIQNQSDNMYGFSSGLEADWLSEKIAELDRVEASTRPFKPSPWVGLLIVIAGLVLLGGILATGILQDSDDESPIAPPSATFEQQLDVTATPSNSPTVTATLTASVTPTASWQASVTASPSLTSTRTPSRQASATDSPSFTATRVSSRTATPTYTASVTRTPRPQRSPTRTMRPTDQN